MVPVDAFVLELWWGVARPGPLPTPPRGSRTRPGHCPVARTRHPLLCPPRHAHKHVDGWTGWHWVAELADIVHAWRLGVCVCVSLRVCAGGGGKPGSPLIGQRACAMPLMLPALAPMKCPPARVAVGPAPTPWRDLPRAQRMNGEADPAPMFTAAVYERPRVCVTGGGGQWQWAT